MIANLLFWKTKGRGLNRKEQAKQLNGGLKTVCNRLDTLKEKLNGSSENLPEMEEIGEENAKRTENDSRLVGPDGGSA